MDTAPVRIGDIKLQPRKAQTAASSLPAELVDTMTDRFNKERQGTKYDPLSYERVGDLVSYIEGDSELYAFLRQLERAKSLPACFGTM